MKTTIARDTRTEILKAALDLFRSRGFGATSMQHVAERAGISKGNLTYHFASKQALFEAVFDHAYTYVRDRLLTRSFEEAEGDAAAALEHFTTKIRRWVMDDDGRFVGCLFTNVAVETQHSDVAVGQLARSALVGVSGILAERFAVAQAAGAIRDDLPAAVLARQFFWMYEGALALSKALDDPAEYDAFRMGLRAWLVR